MKKNIYLIGNTNECQKYLESIDNVNLLPLNSLPVVYFPFQYNKKSSNEDNMKYFSKIIEEDNLIVDNTGEKSYSCNNDEKSVKCSNLIELFNSISNMETEWQPYNNNNIKLILVILIIIWIIILFVILKILRYYLDTYYSKFIIILTILLLIISIVYSLFITAQNY